MIDAIPENERPAHFALAADLFRKQARERADLPNGYAFRFSADALEGIARFIAKDRICCPFLSFTVAVTPNDGPVWLNIAGPEGTREFLASELPGFEAR